MRLRPEADLCKVRMSLRRTRCNNIIETPKFCLKQTWGLLLGSLVSTANILFKSNKTSFFKKSFQDLDFSNSDLQLSKGGVVLLLLLS